MRCFVCDVAYEMGMSEQAFYDKFEKHEREQIIATYRSRAHRAFVESKFPRKT